MTTITPAAWVIELEMSSLARLIDLATLGGTTWEQVTARAELCRRQPTGFFFRDITALGSIDSHTDRYGTWWHVWRWNDGPGSTDSRTFHSYLGALDYLLEPHTEATR